MTEAELLEQVHSAARFLGVLIYHTRDSRRSDPGFPDLVMTGPGGIAFRELKTETGRITSRQAEWLQQLRKAGGDAKVWRTSDWPELVMTELRQLAGP